MDWDEMRGRGIHLSTTGWLVLHTTAHSTYGRYGAITQSVTARVLSLESCLLFIHSFFSITSHHPLHHPLNVSGKLYH